MPLPATLASANDAEFLRCIADHFNADNHHAALAVPHFVPGRLRAIAATLGDRDRVAVWLDSLNSLVERHNDLMRQRLDRAPGACNVHVHCDGSIRDSIAEVDGKLGHMLDLLRRIERKEVQIVSLTQDVIASITALSTTVDSVIAWIRAQQQAEVITPEVAAAMISALESQRAALEVALQPTPTP